MGRKEKRISRILTIQITTPKNTPYNLKILSQIDKRQYAVIMYLLKGMNTKVSRLKVAKEIIQPIKESEFVESEIESELAPSIESTEKTIWEKALTKGTPENKVIHEISKENKKEIT